VRADGGGRKTKLESRFYLDTRELEVNYTLANKRLFRYSICLVLVSAFAIPSVVRSQTKSSGDGILQPAREGLVPVHWPDLTKLETDVREQLASLQNSLAAKAQAPTTPSAVLAEAYGTAGNIYQAYSLFTPARECYLNAGSLKPQDFRWVYLLGKLDQQADRFDEAIRRYLIAVELQPDYVAVPVNLGNIYLQLNRLDDASESFKAALKIEEKNPAANYGLGQVALARRSYAEAVNYFEKAKAQVPGANRIHYSLAMAYRGLGDTEKAKAHLAQQGTVGVRPADPLVDGLQDLIKGERVHLIRGQLALEAQSYAEAVVEFRKATTAKPESLSAHLKLGAVLTQTGDLPGAFAEFEESLRLDPTNTIAHYNLAFLLANENKHEQAIAHLQSVFNVDPNDVGARFLLAQELLRSGRWEEALVEYSRVVQADPTNETAVLERVKLLQRKGQYKQALESLEKSHAGYPQRGQTIVMLAYLLATSPRFELRDGVRALELANLAYNATGVLEHGAIVAMALAELGRCSEAAEWQRKLIAAAEQEHKTELVAKLKTDLRLYEKNQPCRPPGEVPLKD
jgi:tetratricopeptide (TPR) repeat protein